MPLPIAHTAAGISCYLTIPNNTLNGLSVQKRCILALGLIFLANAPDLDFIPGMIIGQPNRFHHSASHSFLGVIILSGITLLSCGNYFNKLSLKMFLGIIFSAVSSHLALDFFSADTSAPYGVPLCWPITSTYYISPVSLFNDVQRADDSVVHFFLSLLTVHNGKEILLELFYSSIFILGISMAKKA